MSDAAKFRTFDLLLAVVTLVAIPTAGWSISTTINNANRIAIIEANRYTDKEAAEDKAALVEEMGKEPLWLKERFSRIEEKLKEIEQDIKYVADKVEKN